MEQQEEQEEQIHPLFKKGFEHGYWLQRGDSKELREVMQGSAKNIPYYTGLKAGQKEAVKEKLMDKFSEEEKERRKDFGLDI